MGANLKEETAGEGSEGIVPILEFQQNSERNCLSTPQQDSRRKSTPKTRLPESHEQWS